LCFGPSGVGKSHAAAAIRYALIERGKRVLFVRTTDMVQRLQAARRDLVLPAVLAKLDKFDAVVLDDLGYARKDQAETAVLFELIAERYERRSLVITRNQPFGTWETIFRDKAMTSPRSTASGGGCAGYWAPPWTKAARQPPLPTAVAALEG
jgi:DNA replication protein DnaC